jgi:hypothetical protein
MCRAPPRPPSPPPPPPASCCRGSPPASRRCPNARPPRGRAVQVAFESANLENQDITFQFQGLKSGARYRWVVRSVSVRPGGPVVKEAPLSSYGSQLGFSLDTPPRTVRLRLRLTKHVSMMSPVPDKPDSVSGRAPILMASQRIGAYTRNSLYRARLGGSTEVLTWFLQW